MPSGSAAGPSLCLHQTYDDVDDLATQARDWNLDFRQLNRGKFRGELLQLVYPNAQLADARFESRLHQLGAPPAGLRTIAVPARPDLELVWRGSKVDGNSLMVFPPDGEFSSVSESDFHVYTCTFPQQDLDRMVDELQLGSPERFFESVEAIQCDPQRMNGLRRLLGRFCAVARQDMSRLATMEEQLTRYLPTQLLTTIGDASDISKRSSTRKREAALAKALDFMMRKIREPMSVQRIADEANVSQRTLEYVFAERFGISPKEYLMMMRFRGLRDDLKLTEPGTITISQIAAHWGFWHMGQLAADYRNRFGELPSETQSRYRSL